MKSPYELEQEHVPQFLIVWERIEKLFDQKINDSVGGKTYIRNAGIYGSIESLLKSKCATCGWRIKVKDEDEFGDEYTIDGTQCITFIPEFKGKTK